MFIVTWKNPENYFYKFRYLFRLVSLLTTCAILFSSLYLEFGDKYKSDVLTINEFGQVSRGSTFCFNQCINIPVEYSIDNYVTLNNCILRFQATAVVSNEHLRLLAEQFNWTNLDKPQTVKQSEWILQKLFYTAVSRAESSVQSNFNSVACTGAEAIPLRSLQVYIETNLNAHLNLFGYVLESLPKVTLE